MVDPRHGCDVSLDETRQKHLRAEGEAENPWMVKRADDLSILSMIDTESYRYNTIRYDTFEQHRVERTGCVRQRPERSAISRQEARSQSIPLLSSTTAVRHIASHRVESRSEYPRSPAHPDEETREEAAAWRGEEVPDCSDPSPIYGVPLHPRPLMNMIPSSVTSLHLAFPFPYIARSWPTSLTSLD